MSGRRALGRGLDALIPQSGEKRLSGGASGGEDRVHIVPIEKVLPNPRQPRTAMDDDSLQELAESVRERGVLEPLLVRPLADGRFELVAGERRLRASARAGLTEVPVLFRDFGERASLEVALIENVQREDLNPIDEARAYQRLVEEFGRTHAEISKAVGKSRSTVTNLLRLLALPEEILAHVSRGTLSAGHGRALLKLEDPADQIRVARQILDEAWSVRETERRVGENGGFQESSDDALVPAPGTEARVTRERKAMDPQVARVEEAIRKYLGTEVHLHHSDKGGRIEIRYFSSEELERLLEHMGVEVY